MPALRPVMTLTLVASALAPATALGATARSVKVEFTVSENASDFGTGVQFVAAPGETNAVTVTRTGTAVTFRDTGAPLTAGDGCSQDAANTVTCRPLKGLGNTIQDVSVAAGDGDDSVVTSTDITAYGEGGSDTLSVDPAAKAGARLDGGAGADHVTGGSRHDILIGGSGADVVTGGAGDDTLAGDTLRQNTLPLSQPDTVASDTGPDADDVLSGGPGSDTISYDTRAVFDRNTSGPTGGPGTPGITVDLQKGTAGSRGIDADRLDSIENVIGTDSDDVLLGDSRANDLDGADGGRDRIDGRAGNDRVGTGGSGKVIGGTGDDVVSTLEGTATCGSGRDFLNPFGRYSTMGGGAPLAIVE